MHGLGVWHLEMQWKGAQVRTIVISKRLVYYTHILDYYV